MNTLRMLTTLVLMLFALSGCKRELSDPHTIDQIYLDLVREQGLFENIIKSAEKALETAHKDYALAEPHSLDRKIQAREIEKASEQLKKATQMAEYFRIRAELRKAYGKKEYMLAFQKGEAWPSKESVDAYFKNKELRLAPRKWSFRVPGSPNFNEELYGDKAKEQASSSSSSGSH